MSTFIHFISGNAVLILLVLNTFQSYAQDSAAYPGIKLYEKGNSNVTLKSYIDAYYGFNLAEPKDGNISYFVSSNRHNEANINLAFFELAYTSEKVRLVFKPGFGTYMNENYSVENGSLKYLLEAYVGFKPFKKSNIWFDFGVLPSPYTNEGPVSRDNLMYTRGLAPENVPYYLSGAKITFPLSEKINAYLYLINGWQQIHDVNSAKSVGTQLEYQINAKNSINWNTYIGDESSDLKPDYRTRYFTDIYWQYNSAKRLKITSGAYMGWQEVQQIDVKATRTWWQVNINAEYLVLSNLGLAGRIEYFSDPESAMITPVTGVDGFSSYSTGLCLNYYFADNFMIRLEGRQFFSDQTVFLDKDIMPKTTNTWFALNFTAWL